MGQKDSRPAHNAYTQPIDDDYSYLPAPNVPKETIEFVMRLLMTLTPLYPDETLLFEDPQNGRTYLNLPTEYFEEILNILPQGQQAKLRAAHGKAIQRLRDDSNTPVGCIPTPDRPYLVVLVHLKCILRKWKDMYRDGDGDGDDDEADKSKPNGPPSSPPPPYTFSPPTQQNDAAQQQRQTSSSTTSPTSFAHMCGRSVPKGPILEQAPCASRHTVACNVARPASLPGVVDQDEVSGGRFVAMTKPAQLFESKLQVRFPDVANIMTAYRDPDVTYFPLALLAINRPFNEQRPELGFFATTPKIVNGDLHLWTDCRIRASTSMELYEILAASRPETWLQPCRHLGAFAYHRMPLRDDNLSYREFMGTRSTIWRVRSMR